MPKLKLQINKNFIIFSFSLFILFACAPSYILGSQYNRENAVVKAVRMVSPAVVNISSEYEVKKYTNPFSGYGIDPFFDSFFKDFFEPGFERKQKRTSLGSGVIIDGERGLILTNEHVITKSEKITVVLKNERKFDAQIVGSDSDFDLAVLRINSNKKLSAIEMGNSDNLLIGETVIAIGNPFGFSNTVTTGVISAINRNIRTDNRIFRNFIQIDASINPGNSGGPLLNINGELIGINTAIYANAHGIGFAIPINKAKRIISDLVQYGEVIQAWIGITAENLNEKAANYLNLTEKRGVYITKVNREGPAYKKGIREGDIILSIGNKNISSREDYKAVMKNFTDGDTVKLNIWRNGKAITVMVKAKVFPIKLAEGLAYKLLGTRVENLNRSSAHKGVVIVELNRYSYLARIGARPGDIIRKIDEITIRNMNDFKKAVAKYRQKRSVVILLQRGGQGYYITVKLEHV